jgi:hypothetical protein
MADEVRNDSGALLAKLSAALELISKGDPIVSLRQELNTRFLSVESRFAAIDKATELQHDDLVRVPTQVDKAVTALEGKMETRFEAIERAATLVRDDYVRVPTLLDRAIQGLREVLTAELHGEITALSEVSKEKFGSVQTQFTLLKQATEQLDLANKTAIAAALQAQKESAGETQKSSQAAIAKSETSTSEAIKALTSTFNASITGATDRINELRGRLDRGEGVTKGTGEAISAQTIAEALRLQGAAVQHGGNQNMIAIGAAVLAAMSIALSFMHQPAPPPAPAPLLQRQSAPLIEPLPKFSLRVAGV